MATAKLQHPVVRKPRDGLWYKAALVGGHEKLAEQVGPKVSPYRIKILWSWSDPNEVSKHKAMPTGCELVLIAGHFLNAETIQKTRMLANKSNARYVQVVTGSVSCIDMGLKTLGLFPNPEWARDLEVVDRATFMSQAKGQAPMVPSIAEVVPVVPLDHPVAVRCSVKRHPTPLPPPPPAPPLQPDPEPEPVEPEPEPVEPEPEPEEGPEAKFCNERYVSMQGRTPETRRWADEHSFMIMQLAESENCPTDPVDFCEELTHRTEVWKTAACCGRKLSSLLFMIGGDSKKRSRFEELIKALNREGDRLSKVKTKFLAAENVMWKGLQRDHKGEDFEDILGEELPEWISRKLAVELVGSANRLKGVLGMDRITSYLDRETSVNVFYRDEVLFLRDRLLSIGNGVLPTGSLVSLMISDEQVRNNIITRVTEKPGISRVELAKSCGTGYKRVCETIQSMGMDGLICEWGGSGRSRFYTMPNVPLPLQASPPVPTAEQIKAAATNEMAIRVMGLLKKGIITKEQADLLLA